MRLSIALTLVVGLACLALATGCEVTPEKIETWKGTKNGPKKLAGTMIDPAVAVELRAQAGVALVAIPNWDLYRESFRKMEPADSAKLIDVMAPQLAKLVVGDGEGAASSLTNAQIDAKDALFVALDYAQGTGKTAAEDALIAWCVADYNNRAMLGDYRIKTIVKKIGARAAAALVPLLTIDQIAITYIADLVRSVEDKEALAAASKQFADALKNNITGIKKTHLEAAFVIGGDAVAGALIEISGDKSLSAELQRFSLRAFSLALEKKTVVLNEHFTKLLFSIAENPAADRYQREETYYVISQAARQEDVPRVKKLLADGDRFLRAVGFRCLLRIDGEGQFLPSLQEIGRLKLTTEEDDVDELIGLAASFPKLLPKVRESLHHESAFVQGVGVKVLGQIGAAADAEILQKIAGDTTRLPDGFGHKTLGEAAAAAASALKKKG